MKSFTLRVDLESDKGIKAVPKLLDLLKKYDMKASFYLVMGGESNFIDVIRYNKKLENAAERKIKIWSFKEKIRMVLFPKDFVKENLPILKRILDEGHELGLHGWKHRAWSRGLHKIDYKEHITKAINKYIRLFKVKPISWSSPAFNINNSVLKELEKVGIRFISDFGGGEVKYIGKIKNIPITIMGENNSPFIEFWAGKGRSDSEILEIFKKEIEDKEIISFYIHGLFEGRFKLRLLEEIFKLIKEKNIKNKRIIDY